MKQKTAVWNKLNPSYKAAEATTLRHWAFQLITSVLATTPFLGPSVN